MVESKVTLSHICGNPPVVILRSIWFIGAFAAVPGLIQLVDLPNISPPVVPRLKDIHVIGIPV